MKIAKIPETAQISTTYALNHPHCVYNHHFLRVFLNEQRLLFPVGILSKFYPSKLCICLFGCKKLDLDKSRLSIKFQPIYAN